MLDDTSPKAEFEDWDRFSEVVSFSYLDPEGYVKNQYEHLVKHKISFVTYVTEQAGLKIRVFEAWYGNGQSFSTEALVYNQFSCAAAISNLILLINSFATTGMRKMAKRNDRYKDLAIPFTEAV